MSNKVLNICVVQPSEHRVNYGSSKTNNTMEGFEHVIKPPFMFLKNIRKCGKIVATKDQEGTCTGMLVYDTNYGEWTKINTNGTFTCPGKTCACVPHLHYRMHHPLCEKHKDKVCCINF